MRREIFMFLVVGATATVTHYLVALLLIELLDSNIYIANLAGYMTAVSVSFFGHGKLTFKKKLDHFVFFRFLIGSLSALALSEVLLWFLSAQLLLNSKISLLIVVIFIPVITFFVNKFWVYKK